MDSPPVKPFGFAVSRNPLPLVYVDDPEGRYRTWYFATSSNALLEIGDDGHKHVSCRPPTGMASGPL